MVPVRPHRASRTRRALLALLVLTVLISGPAGPAGARPTAHEAATPTTTSGNDTSPPASPVPPVPGQVLAAFDPPEHPYGPGHRGVDLAADPHDPIRAAMAGTVTFAGEVARVGWVTIDHGGGLRTTYGAVDPLVATGEAVRTGQDVGWLADDASHLDWGARLDGDYIDPLSLLGPWAPHLTSRPLAQGDLVAAP